MFVCATKGIGMAAAVAGLWCSVPMHAQGRPKASVSVVADADAVHAGSTVRLAVQVSLPDAVHVQSNVPRDPMLIGTAVTVQSPPGVTVVNTVYPAATDFTLAGQATPLSVFEQRFAIGVKLAIAATAPEGSVLTIPIRLRYQACNASTCFAPTREELSLPLRVVPTAVRVTPQQRELFNGLRLPR